MKLTILIPVSLGILLFFTILSQWIIYGKTLLKKENPLKVETIIRDEERIEQQPIIDHIVQENHGDNWDIEDASQGHKNSIIELSNPKQQQQQGNKKKKTTSITDISTNNNVDRKAEEIDIKKIVENVKEEKESTSNMSNSDKTDNDKLSSLTSSNDLKQDEEEEESNKHHTEKDYFCENRAKTETEIKNIDHTSMTSFIGTGGRFPIILVTNDRHEQLRNTLKSLLSVRCVMKEDIYVIQDGSKSNVQEVLDDMKIRYFQKKESNNNAFRGSDGASKIASHYGYSLQHAFSVAFPDAPAVIVVEDDFAFSPDFYEYFHAIAPVIEADSSIWLASAWNDNGFDYLVADPLGVRRTRYFPGLGWLLPRRLWKDELSMKWPHSHWDHWMRDPAQHKNRDIIYPEIPRDYHMGIKGTFMDSGTHNKYFGSIAMHNDVAFTWDTPYGAKAIQNLMIDKYDKRLKRILLHPKTTHFTSVDHISTFSDGVGVVWYDCDPTDSDHGQMRAIAAYFGIWHEGARGSRDGIHELWWQGNAKLFLVNVYGGQVHGHITGAIVPSSLRSLKPKEIRALTYANFQEGLKKRPHMPTHEYLFGAVTTSPLSHMNGADDGNGAPDNINNKDNKDNDSNNNKLNKNKRRNMHDFLLDDTLTSTNNKEEEKKEIVHAHSKFLYDLVLSKNRDITENAAVITDTSFLIVPSKEAGIDCNEVCSTYKPTTTNNNNNKVVKNMRKDAVTSLHYTCIESRFVEINTCAMLKLYMGCTECEDNMGSDQPAMISYLAPEDKSPGKCLVNSDSSMFSCDGKWDYSLRLCPCQAA